MYLNFRRKRTPNSQRIQALGAITVVFGEKGVSVIGGYGLGGCRVDSRSGAAETQTRRSDGLTLRPNALSK